MVKSVINSTVGVVKTKYFTFAEGKDSLKLESGEKIGPITIAYETYGSLNKDKSNAILILHALSGDAHAAGFYSKSDKKPGWWDIMIGPGKAFDTDKYFIICSNILGGCKGSTGPASINPKTKKPYGLEFPIVTVGDMVECQKKLIGHLGINTIFAVCGGSLGGMQVIEWARRYPSDVKLAIPIASAAKLSSQGIAFHEVGRQAIMSDPSWKNGKYYTSNTRPKKGLAIARMIGHITYLSEESMHKKFGRNLQDKSSYGFDFSTDFQVESYLRYQGDSFVKRFDANSYLYITKAIDYYDLAGKKSLEEAVKDFKSKFLIVSFSSDWLFPSSQHRDFVNALRINDIDVTYVDINSPYGHDAFLLENIKLEKMIRAFLNHN